MSIRKTFVIDSNNRSRGDESVFEIDIDKNYFNKVPNAIKIINAKIEVESQFLNNSNNKMIVEKLNGNKIIGVKVIEFPPVSNITSYTDFVNNILNPNLKSQMLVSGIFSDWLEFGWDGSGFTLTNIAGLNVNFDIDDSIGDLLGFGRTKKAGNRSLNVITDLISVNNFNLSVKNKLYISNGVDTLTKYRIEIPLGLPVDNDLAHYITNIIGQTNAATDLINLYNITASTYGIKCNYEVKSSKIQVINELGIQPFDISNLYYDSDSSGFGINGQTFKVPYNTANDNFTFNLINSQGVIVVNTVYTGTVLNFTGTFVNDGIELIKGDLVLVNNTIQKNLNGVYVVDDNTLVRYNYYNGSDIFSIPKLNDFVYVRHNKSYRNSNIRGGFKYDNKIFVLTQAPINVVVDVSEIYFTEFNSRAITYHVDHLFDYDTTNIYIGWKLEPGKMVYEYGVLMDSTDKITPSDNGPLYINNIPVQVGETVLVNNLSPLYNGIYRCSRNDSVWRLERSNYLADVKVDILYIQGGFVEDGTDIYNSLEDNGSIIYNSTAINYNELLYWVGRGVYRCVDDGSNTGLSSKRWRIRKVFDENEFMYDDNSNPYFAFVTARGNGNKKLKMFKLLQSGSSFRNFSNKTEVAKELARIVNITNNFNINAFYQEENLYRPYGNVVDMFEDAVGVFSFNFYTDGFINPLYTPIYSLEMFSNSIGFSNTVKKGNNNYTGDFAVQSNVSSFGSFNIILSSIITKTITLVSNNGIFTTNDLIEIINFSLTNGDQTIVNTSNIRIRFQNGRYVFNSSGIFNVNFTVSDSIDLGFGITYLTGLSSYTSDSIDLIETKTKPQSIYICSDLVDSIDSGSIIPLGGPIPVENVMFVIPNVSNYNDISGSLVLINNSKFAQRFLDNKFDNNKIPIKFWFKLPGGIGFVKKPWSMRCELIFDLIGNL